MPRERVLKYFIAQIKKNILKNLVVNVVISIIKRNVISLENINLFFTEKLANFSRYVFTSNTSTTAGAGDATGYIWRLGMYTWEKGQTYSRPLYLLRP